LSKPTEVESTLAFTIQASVLITRTCAVVDDDVLVAAAPVPPAAAPPEPPELPVLPELEDPAELELLPETDWPTLRATEATTPAMGEVMVAAASWAFAEVSWFAAAASAAVSAAVWVSVAPLLASASTFA
jgi:hypothetical protein